MTAATISGPRTLFRLAGIPVRAHSTLLVMVVFVALSLGLRFTSTFSELQAVLMAIAGALLFVGTLLAHEMAHAVVAKGRGLGVEGITLHVFGGETRMTGEARRPADELWLSAVGPWTSIVLGCAFGLLAHWSERLGARPVAEVAGQLGWLNVLLGGFNLLPGAPLDGGRVLDAAVWRLTRSRAKANAVATGVGQGIGALSIGIGVLIMLTTYGGFVSGLWLAAIGWILLSGARGERLGFELRRKLEGHTVGDLTTPPLCVPSDVAIDMVIADFFRPGRADAVLVTDGRDPVGVIAAERLEGLQPVQRVMATARDVAVPLDHLAHVAASDPAVAAYSQTNGLPVVVSSDDHITGILTAHQLAAALRWLGEPQGEMTVAETMQPVRPRSGRRSAATAAWAGSWAVVVAALVLVPMPLFDIKPGPAIDVASTLATDGPRHPIAGRLLMTSVTIESPSAVSVAAGWFSSHHELVSRASLLPTGVPPADYEAEQLRVFREATRLACAVGLRAAGQPVTILGDGAVVRAVVAGGPADGVVIPGDIITSVGGSKVSSAADLLQALAGATAGAPIALGILRGGERIDVTARPTAAGPSGVPAIGVGVEDANPRISLPFEIRSTRSDIGGPSAGLMTALTAYVLTSGDDLTKGRIIAGTGTVGSGGDIGPIGGVSEKVVAASNAGASVFLVPANDADAARSAAVGHHITVRAVKTVAEAIAFLKAT